MALLANFLQEESGRLNFDINKKITPQSPWLHQTVKKAWPDQMGHLITSVSWERSFPTTEQPWETLVTATGTNNICLPTADLVKFKQTTRNTELATKAVESPEFCIDDLKVKWKRKEQMDLVVRGLAQVTKKYNIERNRRAYQAACGRKVTTDAALTETDVDSLITTTVNGGIVGDAKFPDALPVSIATHGILDHFHAYLDREGAGEFAPAQEGGGNLYTLITSAEHSQWLRKDDAAVRTDFRESSQADKLLKGLGITQTLNGYIHMIDHLPRRWKRNATLTAANGWEEIDPYEEIETGHWELRAEYETADFEDLVIHNRAVHEMLVPTVVTSVGGAKFAPQNYQGDFKFLNIPHIDTNPDGNIGRFRGRLTNGFRTKHPEFGITIRHQRAPLELDLFDVTA